LKGVVTFVFIDWVDLGAVVALQYKRKMGFLHMVKDSLDIFGKERIGPYLHALLSLVFKIFESTVGTCEVSLVGIEESEPVDPRSIDYMDLEAVEKSGVRGLRKTQSDPASNIFMKVDTSTGDSDVKPLTIVMEIANKVVDDKDMDAKDVNEDEVEADKLKITPGGSHDLRTLCLKIIATVLSKFEDFDYNLVYWDIFFQSISPSIQNFVIENHSSTSPRAVFSCLLSMGKSVVWAPLLTRDLTLLPNVIVVFSYKTATPAVVAAVVSLVEGLLNLEEEDGEDGEDIVKIVLLPHLQIVLARVHDLLTMRRVKIK